MKIMYIECNMGAAGDMLTAALLELLPDAEREGFADSFNSLGIPGVIMTAEPSVKHGISGTHVRMTVNGEEEDGHAHHHSGSHVHHKMDDIERIVSGLSGISREVRKEIMEVYSIIAAAESRAHGVPVTEVHFHEVGMMDAIADVTAVCMLMDRIGADRVTAFPLNVGSGTVRSAHGILPVPAPATAFILEGIPYQAGDIESELCTPTVAALLKHFVTEFREMPPMTVEAEGFGMGTKDLERANCVKITLGETQ